MAQLDHRQVNWQRISPKYAFRDVMSMLVGALGWGVITFILVLAVPHEAGPWWLCGAVPLVLTLAFVPMAFVRVRAIGYALRQDDMMLKRGVMFRRLLAVPYGRLQHVDVNQSPLDRMLGIYSLSVVTAATSLTIPGLTKDQSEQLRDHLIRVAESRRAGL